MIKKEKSLLQNEEIEKVSKKPLSDEELSSLIKASNNNCLLYTSPSPRDGLLSRMPSSA